MLLRRQAEPGGKLSARPELVGISDGRGDGCCCDNAEAGDRSEPATGLAVDMPRVELAIQRHDFFGKRHDLPDQDVFAVPAVVRRRVCDQDIDTERGELMEEIFGELQSRLSKSGFDVAAGRRAVLTGGASQLAGVRELATRTLGKQVRLGRPQALPGLAAATAGPAYATAVGLLIAGAAGQAEMNDPNPPRVNVRVERKSGLGRWLAASLFG